MSGGRPDVVLVEGPTLSAVLGPVGPASRFVFHYRPLVAYAPPITNPGPWLAVLERWARCHPDPGDGG